MPSPTALINKVNALLQRYDVSDRKVYKRTVVRTGGDALIGKGGTVTVTDTLMSPQPFTRILGAQEPMVLAGGQTVPAGTLIATVTSTMLTRAELKNPELCLVMKDGSDEEVYFIHGYIPTGALGGIDITYDLVLESKKR